MNVLVINGSPRGDRSNTYRLTRAFLAGLTEKEPAEVETLELNRLDIRPCLGCFGCWNKTPGKCCIQDDMAGVIRKLLWADVTIWSFPLYYFQIPGRLKTLMDRQLPMSLPFMAGEGDGGGHPARYDMSGKRTVLISTCGFYTAQGNYGSVTAMFDRLCGKAGYTSLFCGQGELFRVKELAGQTDAYLKLVQQAGAEYAAGRISEATRQQLNTPLFPRETFEAMADASWGVSRDGQKEEDSLIFTRQMAALYRKENYPGRDLVLEMAYTDLGKTYRIMLTKEGSRVTGDLTGPFTTRIETPYTVWRSIAAGELEGAEAMMRHLYRVEGDFELMLKWDHYFGGGEESTAAPAEKKPTPVPAASMLLLLLPWTAFWVAGGINGFYGSVLALLVCAGLPLVFFRKRMTVYDAISLALVGMEAAGILAGGPEKLILPLSYLSFGLMWLASCFRPIPLTAHYSMNDYNGEAALRNPIFLKTNRILTAAWGVLYFLSPFWTMFLPAMGMTGLAGAIHAAGPILLGIFTGWFQRWYPARVGRG